MHVDLPDYRPRTTFDLPVLTPSSVLGGASMLASVFTFGFVVFVVIPRLLLTAGVIEPRDIAREEPVAEPEPEVIQAAFVQLGRAFDPRELPDRQVSRSTFAQRRQDPNLVSQQTRALTDAGVPPLNAHESNLLNQLGNRADFIERTSVAETEGSEDGMEEGRRTEGSLFAGQIVTLFRRGLVVPPTVPESDLGGLSTLVTVELEPSLTFKSIRISRSSGNADYDRAVQNRIDEILSSNTVLTPPEDSERDRYVGRPFTVNVVPPGRARRRGTSSTPAPAGNALERLGAGYNSPE